MSRAAAKEEQETFRVKVLSFLERLKNGVCTVRVRIDKNGEWRLKSLTCRR